MTSRTFINSAVSTKVVNALMARGNKCAVLKNMKNGFDTYSKINQPLQVNQSKECQVRTKVYRNTSVQKGNNKNSIDCQNVGHCSVETCVDTDQCPQGQETIVSQKEYKNPKQYMAKE